jgi:site-specific DNA-methyltransferase (adenine-specific)
MQFDVIIGNPPYQLNDGGGLGSSAVPIYQHFITQAMKLEPRYLSVVVPSRWFVGGKGLNAFREMMLKDTRLRRIVDYLETSAVFPGVQLKGGVCYFLWERDNKGECEIETHHNGALIHSDVRPLLEPGLDFFIRFGQAIPILRKIIHSSPKAIEGQDLLPQEPLRFSSIVSPRRPFGLASNFEGKGRLGDKGVVTLFQNGGTSFVSREQIPTNKSWIDKWKVYISFAYGAGESYPHSILGKPIIGEPGTACTETYLLIGPFESKLECESVVSYIQTRLFRFLVLQKKQTQNGTRQVYDLVPILKWDHTYTDEELNKKFNLRTEDISFVNSLVRPVSEEIHA